jgi:hypothetical protein
VKVTALRRQPWPARKAAAPAEPSQQQVGDGQREAAQQAAPDLQQQQGVLDAAAEAVLADRGCWPHDSARLAAEADIIAGTLAWAAQLGTCHGCCRFFCCMVATASQGTCRLAAGAEGFRCPLDARCSDVPPR